MASFLLHYIRRSFFSFVPLFLLLIIVSLFLLNLLAYFYAIFLFISFYLFFAGRGFFCLFFCFFKFQFVFMRYIYALKNEIGTFCTILWIFILSAFSLEFLYLFTKIHVVLYYITNFKICQWVF